MKVRILDNLIELGSLACNWEKMMPDSGATPMQEHIWILSCAEALLGQWKLAVVIVEDNAGLRGLAPMMQNTMFPGTYEQLGVASLQEPCDLLYMDASALNSLLAALSQFRKPLVLGRLYADSPTVVASRKEFGGRNLVLTRKCSNLPYIDLDGSVDDVETLLTPSLRVDLRRARRKAEAIGRVDFEIHKPGSAQEFLPLFEEALKVESASWKGQLGSDLASDTARKTFFRRYGLRAAEKGSLRLAFLRIDSEPVAMQFAIQMKNSFWLLKIGYNHAFSKCSPGLLLMLETLRFAQRQGLESYEFLGSSELWTQRWTRQERSSIRIEAYPFTVNGMAAFGHHAMRLAWSKTRQKLKRQ